MEKEMWTVELEKTQHAQVKVPKEVAETKEEAVKIVQESVDDLNLEWDEPAIAVANAELMKEEDPAKLLHDIILLNYTKDDVMLNGKHFDVNVENVPEIALLQVYARLQKTINGDDVVRVEDLVTDGTKVTGGKILPLNNGMFNHFYNGLYSEFLRSIEEQYVRVADLDCTEDGTILSAEVTKEYYVRLADLKCAEDGTIVSAELLEFLP